MPRLSLAGMLFEIEPFEPFPEFVAGPLNAGSFGPNPLDGTFGPNPLDGTFGPEVVFQKAAPVAKLAAGGLSVLRRGGD